MNEQEILFEFFETEMDKSELFKSRKNLEAKLKELDKKNLTTEKINKLSEEKQQLQEELESQRKLSAIGEIRNWIELYAAISIKTPQNKTISLATHPIKLTHSSIKEASSVLSPHKNKSESYLITTVNSREQVDIAHPDNKLAQISKLFLFLYKKEIINPPVNYDFSIFKPFAENQKQFEKWKQGFSIYLGSGEKIKSHSLAKQLYFPVKGNYHLLSPLVSSSLDKAVYEKIQHFKFEEPSISIRKQKSQNKYHSELAISYPNIAILKVTASNHSNASIFNGLRGGKRYLLSSMPPNWKSSLKPPINQDSLFYGEFDHRAWQSVKKLQKYLLAIQAEKSNKEIRDKVKESINDIIATLFDYVAEIQNLNWQTEWRENTRLALSHQLWLDPYREDDIFQQNRKRGDWQDEVCNDFGKWVNTKLEHEKMKFSKIESKSWAKLLKGRLREFEYDLELIK